MRRVILSVVVIVLLVTLTIGRVSAVAPDELINVLNEDSGLIDNSVTALVYDSPNDILYIGTPSGLSVYDIVEEDFVLNKTYSDSLNDIVDICNVYDAGGAYVLTANQSYPVREFLGSPESDELLNISFSGLPTLSCITHAQDNLLFIGSDDDGVFEFDGDTLTQYNVSHDSNNTDNNQVSDLIIGEVVSSSDWLFIGTNNGVWVFDIDAKTFLNFGTLETIGYSVQSLYFDNPENSLYVGTPEGLYIYSITETTATLEATVNEAYQNGDLNDQNIQSLGFDISLRQLYIGTPSELVKYDLDSSGTVQMNAFAAELGFSQLTDSFVTAIAVDQINDTVYVGTQNGGVNVFAISSERGVIDNIVWIMGGLAALGIFTIIGIIIKLRN